MGQALYRSYRPKKLSEVIGQEHITTALTRALKNGALSHAYLFTGPRGTGKTSIARILAHEINGLAYDSDQTHLDIIEIDAASNRRIDEIRDLRDKVHTAPTSAKYKVYIIDEVHMLTREAFNALLKTLEEPPAHAVFILATTEAHKLPETIISRTQRYAFRPIEGKKVVDHLRTIATAEKIDITDDALALIAVHGEGSMRDSTSLLDQVRNTGEKIDLDTVHAALGIAPEALIAELITALSMHDTVTVASILQQMQAQGYEPAQVARQLGGALRTHLLAGTSPLANTLLMQLLATLIDVPASANPRSMLEIAVLDIALTGAPQSAAVTPATPRPPAATPAPASTKVLSEAVQTKPAVQIEPHPSSLRKPAPRPQPAAESTAPTVDATTDENTSVSASSTVIDTTAWQQILATIKQTHNTLYSIAQSGRPQFEAGKITLAFGFAFHQKRLNEPRNKQTLNDIILKVTGQPIQLQCIVAKAADLAALPAVEAPGPVLPPEDTEVIHAVAATPATAPKPQNEAVAAISNIFGEAELLES